MAKNDFKEVVTLNSPDNVFSAVITCKITADGMKRFSFAILRNIAQEGGTGRTPWAHPRHIPTLRKLLDEVDVRLAAEDERARLEFARKK